MSVGKQKGDRSGDRMGDGQAGVGVWPVGKQVKSIGVRKGTTNIIGVGETNSNSSSTVSSPHGSSSSSKGVSRKRNLHADANRTIAIHSTSSPPPVTPQSLPTNSSNSSSSNNISFDIPNKVEQLEYCLYRHMLTSSLQISTVPNKHNNRTSSTSSSSMPMSKVSSKGTPLPSASVPSASSSSRSVPSESSASLPWTEVEVTLLHKLGAVFGRTDM